MDHIALFETHRHFFDVAHIRGQDPVLAKASDKELAEKLLHPKNATPPAPNRIFDPLHYNLQRRRLEPTNLPNPIVHYLAEDTEVNLSVNALFDAAYYKRTIRRPDLDNRAALSHALDHLETELSGFSPFVDLDFLCEGFGRKKDAALLCDLFSGELQPARPHPLFDLEYFSLQSGITFETLADALRHYWTSAEDISTHPMFDVAFYKSHFPEQAGINRSVYHYLVSAEQRSPHPLFDSAFYSEQVASVMRGTPARLFEHFLSKGQALDLSPSPFFDLAYYRRQSQCGANAVQNYLEGGHHFHSPHPMIDLAQAQLFSRSLESPPAPLTVLFADEKQAPPLELTPEFVPEYFAGTEPVASQNPQALRRRYFREGYPTGQRPNGLLSMPYIADQCRWLDIEAHSPLAGYFEAGLHRRPRFVLALDTLEHNTANVSWLALLKSQIGNPATEFVVVSAQPGPMSSAFSEVAHVWHLALEPLAELAPSDLKSAVNRFNRSLASNPTTVCFVEYSEDLILLQSLSGLGAPLFVFGDDRLAHLSPEDADILTETCAHILCASPRTKDKLTTIFAEAGPSISDGFHAITRSGTPTVERRLRARRRLGMGEEAQLIISSGGSGIEHGADLFGALAAQCFEDGDFPDSAVFHWYGPDKPFGNRPNFYGRLNAENAEGRTRFRLMEDDAMATAISAADAYVKLGRDGCPLNEVMIARDAGVPVVLMSGPASATTLASEEGVHLVDAFDLAAARRCLRDILAQSGGSSLPVASPKDTPTTARDLSAFADHIAKLLDAEVPGLKLTRPSRNAMSRLLIVMPDKDMFERLSTLTEKHDLLEGTAALWFDQSHVRREDFPDVLRVLLDEQDCSDLVVVDSADQLSEHLICGFTRSLWLLQGSTSELNSLYRKGLEFDVLLTRNPDQIAEMRALNAVIADAMTTRDWRE